MDPQTLWEFLISDDWIINPSWVTSRPYPYHLQVPWTPLVPPASVPLLPRPASQTHLFKWQNPVQPHNPGRVSPFTHSVMQLLIENVFIQHLYMSGTGLGITMSNIQRYRKRKRENPCPPETHGTAKREGESSFWPLLCHTWSGVSNPDIPGGPEEPYVSEEAGWAWLGPGTAHPSHGAAAQVCLVEGSSE